MSASSDLGFPQKPLVFLKKLKKNNSREWFEVHREQFENDFFHPAVAFVLELGELLQDFAPDVLAIPKTDKSIFRLHRDVRFSKNKAPFKTNLGIWFYDGRVKKMESCGFYFHLEPEYFFLATGMYMFTKEQMKIFRDAVSDPIKGGELKKILSKLEKNKRFTLGGEKYKKIPKGYDPDHPMAKYFLYESIYTSQEGTDFSELTDGNIIKYCFKIFKEMSPLHFWLVKNVMKV
jgi:uncharacterized protein (TIGR02453 family)